MKKEKNNNSSVIKIENVEGICDRLKEKMIATISNSGSVNMTIRSETIDSEPDSDGWVTHTLTGNSVFTFEFNVKN